MHVAGSSLVLSATDLSGFLACGHLTTLNHRKALGGPKPPKFDDPGVEVLIQRGHEHEAQILAAFKAQGLDVFDAPQNKDQDPATRWPTQAAATLEAMRAGADIIYQGTLFDGRWLGLPDFMRRVDGAGASSALGDWSYEVIDAKLAREAKVGAVLQITLYSDLLAALQHRDPEQMYLALGKAGGKLERFRYHDFAAYYRSVRARFLAAVQDGPESETSTESSTYPEPVPHCDVCAWKPVCKKRWRKDDHLSLVAGISRKQRSGLEEHDVATLESLAESATPFPHTLEGVSHSAFHRVREQARIQLEGRREETHKYELFQEVEEGNGLLALPTPSPGDLFFDIEGDPHAFDAGIEYLLGWVDDDAEFTGLWAFTPDEERAQFEQVIDLVMDRLERWPEMHVYHYAAYEKTAAKRLAFPVRDTRGGGRSTASRWRVRGSLSRGSPKPSRFGRELLDQEDGAAVPLRSRGRSTRGLLSTGQLRGMAAAGRIGEGRRRAREGAVVTRQDRGIQQGRLRIDAEAPRLA